jgi:hypothetical protein
MPGASYAQTSFLGGEVSQFAQGRFDQPDWRTRLAVCLNGFPVETGAWVRAPGTQFAGTTRSGSKARVIKFDVAQATPYIMEFSDGFLRFWQGAQIQFTNDNVGVTGISTGNPALFSPVTALGWQTGDQVMFGGLGATCPLLQNRQFTITRINSLNFSLADAITGANIDGSTLGVASLSASAMVSRILDLGTPYAAGSWALLRSVQAMSAGGSTGNTAVPISVLLHSVVPPYVLTAGAKPVAQFGAGFTLNQAVFLDGPYLDPFTNGVQANPGSLVGLVTFTLSFPAYSATKAYKFGDFVTFAGVNYESIADNNVGNALAPPWFSTVSAGAAINNGLGFLGTDVGRLVRFYSEPAAWAVGTAYVTGNVVSYNPTGQPGAETFWGALANSTGKVPGTDLVNWQIIPTGAAIWTWGKIISLGNMISQTLASSVNIGTLTGNGGVAASFDSVPSKASASCSALAANAISIDGYVGKDYHSAAAQKIEHGTLYPSTDFGLSVAGVIGRGDTNHVTGVTVNLRAKATAPASASDGTLLGTTGTGPNTLQPITIQSNDQATAWNYVWFEIIATFAAAEVGNMVYSSQAQFFNPPGSGAGNTVNVEILGPPLLYTTPIITWRLGAYSNTTGWPTCGTWASGRLWLSGVFPNRADASAANGITGNNINFAPTDQNGVVGGANGISIVLNSETINPIFSMMADQQGIICFTQGGEFLIFAPGNGGIAPNNIDSRPLTSAGCANVEPRRTEHTKVVVQRYGRKLLEYFPDVFSGKFTAPNLAEKAMHLTRNGIVEIAYQQAVTPIIWARDAVGNLLGIVYKRDTLMTSQGPTFVGWFRRALGTGRVVESIAVGPSVGGNLDSLTMVTNDPATNIRHVEVMTDMLDELAPLSSAWYLDDAVTGTSTAASAAGPYGGLTVNGLWHLNGKTVQAFVGGLDCGLTEGGVISDFTVVNGSITIPYGDGVSAGSGSGLFTQAFAASLSGPQAAIIGVTYNSDGQLVRAMTAQESGARTGPALGKVRRNHKVAALLNNAKGLLLGTSFAKLMPAILRQFKDGPAITTLNTFSGVYKDTISDDESYDGMVCWRVSRPYPCNIMAIEPFGNTKDE